MCCTGKAYARVKVHMHVCGRWGWGSGQSSSCFFILGFTIWNYLVLKFRFQGSVQFTQVLVEALGSGTMAVAICQTRILMKEVIST